MYLRLKGSDVFRAFGACFHDVVLTYRSTVRARTYTHHVRGRTHLTTRSEHFFFVASPVRWKWMFSDFAATCRTCWPSYCCWWKYGRPGPALVNTVVPVPVTIPARDPGYASPVSPKVRGSVDRRDLSHRPPSVLPSTDINDVPLARPEGRYEWVSRIVFDDLDTEPILMSNSAKTREEVVFTVGRWILSPFLLNYQCSINVLALDRYF